MAISDRPLFFINLSNETGILHSFSGGLRFCFFFGTILQCRIEQYRTGLQKAAPGTSDCYALCGIVI